MRVARIVVDIPAREIDEPFDYLIPDDLAGVTVGSCVLVDFARRPAVGYCVAVSDSSDFDSLKPITALLGGPYFTPEGADCAEWIAHEYLCPLSEAVRLFAPPGGAPRAVRSQGEDGVVWTVRHAAVGPVDDRWVQRDLHAVYTPKPNATMQRAVLDALSEGPVRVAELSADLGAVDGALWRLQEVGAVTIEHRRRLRDARVGERTAVRPQTLTAGQREALGRIAQACARHTGRVVLLDGVTGSGKTEVYLQAIEEVVAGGQGAIVLVPEISLTPQTVGRFRARFGDHVAVLHSRLSPGERFDQWDLARRGDARIVVGARSALFAPVRNVGLIVIDEEHESSYKQSSAPRYHARDVAAHLAARTGAALVLGSATPSLESLQRCAIGEWTRVVLPERATGAALPQVTVVDMTVEFADGHRSMFSRPLADALRRVAQRKEKAVVLLNRRGFASFLLCRECGFVPECDSCSTSLTYHEVGSRLTCHHCNKSRPVPAACPRCGSPYLRQFGAGTQRVESELTLLLPELPVIRMDADTTRGKGGHERALAAFEGLASGVLLGTQMIAKGLDYPDVTLVGVVNADTTLHLPDFRAGERTYQLLEQVSGRAGRADRPGTVVIQTYWPEHQAIKAAAAHDAAAFYSQESASRRALGYPPFGRLANALVWGRVRDDVASACEELAALIGRSLPDDWQLLGPSPAPLSRLKDVWRWHLLIKAPAGADLPRVLRSPLKEVRRRPGVSIACDVDPVSLL